MARLTRTMRWLLLSWPSFAGALVVLWLFSQSDHGAALYGRLNPVTSPLQVTNVEPASVNGAPGSRISGTAVIHRDTCDYLDVEWELHGDRRSVRATAFFADEARVREAGVQRWEALLVGVPPHKLRDTTGDVRHQCGMFPVMSPFYRPDESILPAEAGATAICESGAYTSSTGPGTCSGHGGVNTWIGDPP